MAFCLKMKKHILNLFNSLSQIWVSVTTERVRLQAISPLSWIWIGIGIWVPLISRSMHYFAASIASSRTKRWWINNIFKLLCMVFGILLTQCRPTFLLLSLTNIPANNKTLSFCTIFNIDIYKTLNTGTHYFCIYLVINLVGSFSLMRNIKNSVSL